MSWGPTSILVVHAVSNLLPPCRIAESALCEQDDFGGQPRDSSWGAKRDLLAPQNLHVNTVPSPVAVRPHQSASLLFAVHAH